MLQNSLVLMQPHSYPLPPLETNVCSLLLGNLEINLSLEIRRISLNIKMGLLEELQGY